jgi:hypothetical protein
LVFIFLSKFLPKWQKQNSFHRRRGNYVKSNE